MPQKKTVLLLTDFSYQAKGRDYFREDVELSSFLRKYFHVWVSHIDAIEKVLHAADAVLIRNTGPQASHQKQLLRLKQDPGLRLFNDLSGKGDINGKQHLLDLFRSEFPVIPSFASKEELEKFGTYERYLVKPFNGADSCGVKILTHEELLTAPCHNVLIQPFVEFEYEISFYFIGRQFHYALYAPDPQKRWELKPYAASKEDKEFASKFITWNSCTFGIQRVDACRLQDGTLLLMELEDYNPFLSLDCLPQADKELFLEALCHSLTTLMSAPQ